MALTDEGLDIPRVLGLSIALKKILVSLIALGVLGGSSIWAEGGQHPAPEIQMQKWYEEHIKGNRPIFDEAQRKFWDITFDAALVEKLNKENWGFDPLFFGQDAEIKDLKITRIENGDSPTALVLIAFTNFGKRVELIALMGLSDAGWKLVNIFNPEDGVSLLRDLSE